MARHDGKVALISGTGIGGATWVVGSAFAIIAAGGGSVINMAANVALTGVAGRDCYTAAKAGIGAITRSMAVAFAPNKVRVNAIAPSATMRYTAALRSPDCDEREHGPPVLDRRRELVLLSN